MTDKIIRFPKPNKRPARVTMSERLRGIARLPTDDRPLIAQNLGRMVASIDQENPLRAAKAIFEICWPNDPTKWAKRKRSFRLEGEDLGNPKDYGTYEAAGATYQRLAQAIAERSGPFKDETALEQEVERRVMEMLWGTSLRDNNVSLDETTLDARNLIVELATAIENRVSATGITRLWEILKTSPFGPRDMQKANAAENEDNKLIPIHDRNGKAFNYHDSDVSLGQVLGYAAGWAEPWMRVGWLLKRVTGEMLLLPENINLDGMNADEPNDPAVRQIEAWAREWGGGDPDDPASWAYPTHSYEHALGHGWVTADFDIIYLVELAIIPNPNGAPELRLFLSKPDETFDQIIPALLTDHLHSRDYLKDSLDTFCYDRDDWVIEYGIFEIFPQFLWKAQFDGLQLWVNSSAEKFGINLNSRLNPGKTLGLLDLPGRRALSGKKLLLSQLSHGDDAEMLVGSNQYHFVSNFEEKMGVPTPCRSNSIAASMLRNAILEDDGARLSSLLEKKALHMAKLGLDYHMHLINFHRNAVKQSRGDKQSELQH